MQGSGDGTYHPAEPVTRAQMAAYVARALAGGDAEVTDAGCDTPPFPDVACDHWARKHIQYIQSEGVTGGYADGKYHPEYTVTRDQMAVYVARGFQLAQ